MERTKQRQQAWYAVRMPAKAAAALHNELCSQSVCLRFGSANFEAMVFFGLRNMFLQGQPAIRSELFPILGDLLSQVLVDAVCESYHQTVLISRCRHAGGSS